MNTLQTRKQAEEIASHKADTRWRRGATRQEKHEPLQTGTHDERIASHKTDIRRSGVDTLHPEIYRKKSRQDTGKREALLRNQTITKTRESKSKSEEVRKKQGK